MIVEKPAWLSHAGLQIFSMDVQPSGQRCATAGGDHKVRIWNTGPLMKEPESELGSQKLLATLCDHFGSVNCVRWSRSGLFIASGSDDQFVLIHEKRPGTGTVEFGSGEPPNVENWKVLASLRGHTADVVDLAWSPDDSMLATCGLDTTVRIWKMPGGASLSVLTGHTSLVKGVAWDPIGSFLATQSDDKTVIIWQTSNWSPVHKAEGPWKKSVGSTFFRRLAWSPCGHFIITTHGFQKPSHTAQVLERGDWSGTFNFVGHNAPVVAVRFNHSMFRKQPLPPADEEQLDPKKVPKEMQPYNVVAIGSQDRNVTVWSTANPRPIFVGKHFFAQSVVDLTWSPDGYSLFCCSLDGTVASFHFEPKELGHIVPDKEMEELKKVRYGDRGRQLAETPAQLLIEAAAAKRIIPTPAPPLALPAPAPAPASSPAAAQSSSLLQKQASLPVLKAPETTPPAEENAGAGSGSTAAAAAAAPQAPKPTPVRQREYRQQDGRRRIIPEALPTEDSPGQAANGGRREAGFESVGEKRKLPAEQSKSPMKRMTNGRTATAGATTSARASAGEDVFSLGVVHPAAAAAIDVTRAAELKGPDGVFSVQVSVPEDELGSWSSSAAPPLCLEAKSAAKNEATTETDVICSQGGEVRWRDRYAGKVTALTGNTNFWAIGCEDGSLQVYTMAGRRALPSILVGSAAAFMDCTREWELLLLTRGGTMHVWDIQQASCLLSESLFPLISSSSASSSSKENVMKIISARFSQAGAPLIVLANGHAFLFHRKMRSWLRVADDTFPASSFVSSLPSAAQAPNASEGELAQLQKGPAMLGKTTWNKALVNEKYQTRAHLEDQMASALALESPEEYKRHLIAYTRFLTREADEVRLRELCTDLLGPLFVPDSEPCESQPIFYWDPHILGMNKRELLRTEVLPAMASNRGIQRLLNEFFDLLSEYQVEKPNSSSAEEQVQQQLQEQSPQEQQQ